MFIVKQLIMPSSSVRSGMCASPGAAPDGARE